MDNSTAAYGTCCRGASSRNEEARPAPVGSKAPNAKSTGAHRLRSLLQETPRSRALCHQHRGSSIRSRPHRSSQAAAHFFREPQVCEIAVGMRQVTEDTLLLPATHAFEVEHARGAGARLVNCASSRGQHPKFCGVVLQRGIRLFHRLQSRRGWQPQGHRNCSRRPVFGLADPRGQLGWPWNVLRRHWTVRRDLDFRQREAR